MEGVTRRVEDSSRAVRITCGAFKRMAQTCTLEHSISALPSLPVTEAVVDVIQANFFRQGLAKAINTSPEHDVKSIYNP